jgi:hypothetical protein
MWRPHTIWGDHSTRGVSKAFPGGCFLEEVRLPGQGRCLLQERKVCCGVLSRITVTPPQQVVLQVATTPYLPRQLYIVHVSAESGGLQQAVEIQVDANATIYQISLPMILSGWTATR